MKDINLQNSGTMRSFKSELLFSLKAVWYIISAVLIFIIMLSLFYPALLLKISPACTSKTLHNEECFLCGTTKAFTEIPKGNFSEANELNRLSLYLYALLLLNSFVFLVMLFKNLQKIIFKEIYTSHLNNFISKFKEELKC